ncbi:TIGR03905 family TSCPD domain-containing protein [Terrisporobacter sp.]|uniref:TIGR03905 family TSCPD domain-containing protein n=1 Tax=Terrisporobacter sp. TaxID=1965305 RepID=UPI003FCCCF3C
MKHLYRYITKGVCAKSILLNIEGDILLDVVFEGGCDGSLIALKHFVEGRQIDQIINELEYIPCRNKKTSCPDQLAKALKVYKEYVLKK